MKSRESAHNSSKHLFFECGGIDFGINLSRVQEIVQPLPLIRTPGMPRYMMGQALLREHMIGVIDLSEKLGLNPNPSNCPCVIVLEVQSVCMKKCWVDKKCSKEGCPAHGSEDMRCWMISGTFCRNEIQGTYHQKIEACRQCSFYQEVQTRNLVFRIGLYVERVLEIGDVNQNDIVQENSNLQIKGEFLAGYLLPQKQEERVKLLLDVDGLFCEDKKPV